MDDDALTPSTESLDTQPTNARARRTYVVGDVHGCFDEMLALEHAARAQTSAECAEADVFFVYVGDLVDRGPRAKDVVAHVKAGVTAGTHACVGGNHEAFLVETVYALAPWNFDDAWPLPSKLPSYSPGFDARYLHEGVAAGMKSVDFKALCRTRWMKCGGRETLLSFGCDPDDITTWQFDRDLLAFLVGLPLMWEDEHAVVTHALATRADLLIGASLAARSARNPAGFHAGLSPREQRILDGLLWCREMPTEAPAPGKLHVTGHTPLERPCFDSVTGVVNVDTACVFGGALTAVCLETRVFLSVPGWSASPYA